MVHFDAKSYPSLVGMSGGVYLTAQADTIHDECSRYVPDGGFCIREDSVEHYKSVRFLSHFLPIPKLSLNDQLNVVSKEQESGL